jgi:hypothetical protein
VFQIGQHLLEQRRRRGLTLEECERATRIRGRYLIALEEDRPEDIPDPAYARLFLRGYAAFLGLDADAMVAEYDERRGAAPPIEEHRVVPLETPPAGRLEELKRWIVRPRRRSRRRELGWVAIGMLGTLAAVIWLGAHGSSPSPPEQEAASVPRPAAAPSATAAPAVPRPAAAGPARLELTGAGTGGCWVRVQRGGPAGPVAYEGTLAPAQTVRLPVTGTLWLRVGWAPSLRVSLGGDGVALPGGTGTFMVTRDRVAPAT